MKSLHDLVFDVFGIMPDDVRYKDCFEAVQLEMHRPTLSLKVKETLLLYYHQKLTVSQIASLLGVDKSTVSKRLSGFRIKLKLRYIYLTK